MEAGTIRAVEEAAFVVSVFALVVSALAVWHSRRSANASVEATGYKRDEVERNRIRFVLHRVAPGTFALRNLGTDTAYRVEVDVGQFKSLGPNRFDVFGSGHSERIILDRILGCTTTHVGVTWHRLPDGTDPQSVRLWIDETQTVRVLI